MPLQNKCECSDKGCPAHKEEYNCDGFSSVLLIRADMEDKTGTWFCFECAEDALEAGVYRLGDWKEMINNRR